MVEDSSERIVIDVISLISRSVDVMIVMNVMFSNLMKIYGKYIIFLAWMDKTMRSITLRYEMQKEKIYKGSQKFGDMWCSINASTENPE